MCVCARVSAFERKREKEQEGEEEREGREKERERERRETKFSLAFITSSIMSGMSSTVNKAVFN